MFVRDPSPRRLGLILYHRATFIAPLSGLLILKGEVKLPATSLPISLAIASISAFASRYFFSSFVNTLATGLTRSSSMSFILFNFSSERTSPRSPKSICSCLSLLYSTAGILLFIFFHFAKALFRSNASEILSRTPAQFDPSSRASLVTVSRIFPLRT